MNKKTVDIAAIVCLIIVIVSGFVLHSEIHHQHIYDNKILWYAHETAGILLLAAVANHCTQHKFWFRNYRRIPAEKKRVTTLLLTDLIFVAVSGVMLMCGSQSNSVSIFHYITGIIFTLMTIGHIAKRWQLFKGLYSQQKRQ